MLFELASLVHDRITRWRLACSNGRHRADRGPSWSETSIESFVSELRS